jgi:sphingolipid delta-4 desaturase
MLWVLIHDLSHDAVFESSWWNKVYHCIANFPIFFPAAISFRYYHRLHHSKLNTAYADPDLPGKMENKVFGTSTLGKMVWLALFAFIQILRTARFGPSLGGNEPWMVVNWITQLAYNYAMYHFFGWTGIIYMFAASVFAIGLHPLGTRWIAEHYSIKAPQETYSYYGSLNYITGNIGYHNEHHDLPSIPWQNLPKVRAIAPEFYEDLWYHTSYLRLLWHFLTDSRFTLETRTVRLDNADTPYLKKDKKGGKAAAEEQKGEEEPAPPSSGGMRRRQSSKQLK